MSKIIQNLWRYYNERIVIDENVITSYSPETAADVAFELLRKLSGTEKMMIVREAMGYK